jgi:RNA polymerase sigma-70 factor, ECF subfamily
MPDAMEPRYADVVLPHLDAAYRLARWLLRNDHDAEDAVQEAALRAFRYFRTFSGSDGRAWFFRIVRHVCWNWRGRAGRLTTEPFDEERHTGAPHTSDPERGLLRSADAAALERALGGLPGRFRELLVLRELEGLSYRELADAIGIPMGTVMSGLSRARAALRVALGSELKVNSMTRKVEDMMKKAVVMMVALGTIAHLSAQGPALLARFDGGIGVQPVANVAGTANPDGTFPNVKQNVVRGVIPAGPWRIDDLKADVFVDGRIRVRGRGLLLASGNSIGQNANQKVFATLICEPTGPFVEHSTSLAGVPLDADGDFRIDDTLDSVPAACASPVLLIRTTGNGTWFAAGIPQIGSTN